MTTTRLDDLRKAMLDSWTLTYQREQAYVETLEGAAGRWATERKKRRLAFRRDGMEPRLPGSTTVTFRGAGVRGEESATGGDAVGAIREVA